MPRSLLILLLFVAGLALPASPVAAQGTSGTLPDPMSSLELARHLDRVGLSPNQLQAINDFHDRYRNEYTRLRDDEIESFMERAEVVRGGMGFMSNLPMLETLSKDYDRLLARIATLDNRLFDEIETVLADDQLAMMTRVRDGRKRTRYRSGMSRMLSSSNPAAHLDLVELAYELRLPIEDENVDGLFLTYERQLTSEAKKFHEAAGAMPIDVAKRMSDNGFTEDDFGNPRRRGEMFETFRTIWSEAGRPAKERALAMSDLNYRTLRSVQTVMPRREARRLRRIYLERGYADAIEALGRGERVLERALDLTSVEGERREAVEGLYSRLLIDGDRLTDELVGLIDEDRSSREMFRFGRGSSDPYQAKLDELQARQRALDESTIDALRQVLGETLADRVIRGNGEFGDDEEDGGSDRFVVSGAGGGQMTISLDEQGTTTAAADLPVRIGARELERYATMLDLDETMLPILEALHEDYTEQFEALDTGVIDQARRAARSLADEDEPADPEEVLAAFTLERRAHEEAQVVDEAFLSDAELALGLDGEPERMERVRHARRRGVYQRGLAIPATANFGRGGGRGFGRNRDDEAESRVDLSRLVADLSLAPADLEAARPELNEYDRTLTAMLATAWEQHGRLRESIAVFSAESATQRNGDGRNFDFRRYRDMMATVGSDASSGRRGIVQLNRRTLGQLTERLPSDAAATLRRTWQRQAFPEVYDDSSAVAGRLTAARALPDLTTDQRLRLDGLVAEYQSQYDTLSDRMVAVYLAADPVSDNDGWGRGRWQQVRQQREALDRIRFDRDDVAAKTVSRLQTVLSEEQFARLGVEGTEG